MHLEYVILSEVFGVHIIITPISISNATNCEEEGTFMDMLFWDSYLPSHIIFEDLSDLSKVSNINSTELVWYHLLISNFLPKNKDPTSLDIDEKYFLLLLNSDLKIDLPQVMFEYLKITLTSFKEGKSSFIPYGRVFCELFIQQGVKITMTEVKTQLWGDKLKLTETSKTDDLFKVKVVFVNGSSLLFLCFDILFYVLFM